MTRSVCGIGNCPGIVQAQVARGQGLMWLCATHYVRWSTAASELAAERSEVSVRLALLADRIQKSSAAGRRAHPGSTKALAKLGRGDDKRRQARRMP